jgi:hypothetical protein
LNAGGYARGRRTLRPEEKGRRVQITIPPDVLEFLRWYASLSSLKKPTLRKVILSVMSDCRTISGYPDRPTAPSDKENITF